MSIQADIVIPSDKLQDFFFLDDDEEEKEYGGAGFSAQKMANATLSAAQIMKDKAKEQANQFKQIQDFKVRVLDFVAIYIKEMKKQ